MIFGFISQLDASYLAGNRLRQGCAKLDFAWILVRRGLLLDEVLD